MKMGLVVRLLSTEGFLASCITLINHKSFCLKTKILDGDSSDNYLAGYFDTSISLGRFGGSFQK